MLGFFFQIKSFSTMMDSFDNLSVLFTIPSLKMMKRSQKGKIFHMKRNWKSKYFAKISWTLVVDIPIFFFSPLRLSSRHAQNRYNLDRKEWFLMIITLSQLSSFWIFPCLYFCSKMTLLLHFLLQSREFSDTGLTDTKKAKTVQISTKRWWGICLDLLSRHGMAE